MKWGRVLLAAFLAEVVLIVLAAAFYLAYGEAGATAKLVYVVPPACLLAMVAAGYWVARKAGDRPILHGTLVGVAGALMYVALTWGKTLPLAYVVSHFLKIIGGALGGWLATRVGSRTPSQSTS